MEIALLIESLAPWLGGGAVTVAAGFTIWLWTRYHQRSDTQWSQQDELLNNVRKEHTDALEDRNYWRQIALDRHAEIGRLEQLIQDLQRRNSELEKQNALLQTQIDILRQMKESGEG